MSSDAILNKYGPTSRLLHWLTVLLVIHIWAGLAILLIVALRFPWRIANPPPPAEANEFNRWLISWTDPAARLTHYALYLLLFAVPIVGILLQFSRGHALPLFGLAEIASPLSADRGLAHNLKELHEVLADLLVIVALLHAGAAIVHHVVFRDNTLVRMAPWLRKADPKVR